MIRRPVISHAPVRTLLIAIALVVAALAAPAVASASTYDPLDVIPYETWRGAASLSAADIQAFLETLDGPLKTLVANEHDIAGVTTPVKKPASQLIYEAARFWNLNPKVILATLQKEQSLLTISNSDNSARFRKAMGAGVYGDADGDGRTDNRYPGFGNQIWNGARLLSTYEIMFGWYPGKTKAVTAYKYVDATRTVDGHVETYQKRVSYTKTIVPKNASTFALYTYTPYYPQKGVWDIYVRYFGDPHTPPRMLPVYRFRNRYNGSYFYTKSEAKRYTLIRTASRKWDYGGVSFTVDTSATANNVPLFHMYNTRKDTHYYTTSEAKKASLLSVKPLQWRYEGVTCYVSRDATDTLPVYRVRNTSTGANLLISSWSKVKQLLARRSPRWEYRGVYFRLAKSAETTPPVGPTIP